MTASPQKTPFVDSFTRNVGGAVEAGQEQQGRSPPASIIEMVGSTHLIAKCKVEVDDLFTWPPITCPVALPEFLRPSIGPGTKGFLVSSDYYLGGMSGLGGGTARLTRMTNLSTCVFVPFGNTAFQPHEDPTKTLAYGNTGVILRDKDNVIRFVLDKNNGLTITWNGQPLMTFSNNGIQIQYQGRGINIQPDGTRIDGVNFLPHRHSGVTAGPDNTGPVVP